MYGYGGVDVFFVLSGFCLAYPYFARPRPDSWSRYFAKRAARILPPYYAAALLFWSVNAYLCRHPLGGLYAFPLDAKGVFICFSMLGVELNPSFWTLVLEARWYFVFPVLLIAWRRWPVVAALCALVLSVTAPALNARVPHYQLAFGLVWLFLPTFLLGIQAADVTVRGTWRTRGPLFRWICLGAAIALGTFISSTSPDVFAVPSILLWALFAWSLLLASLYDPVVGRIARSKPLVWLGLASYSIYLIHEPIVHYTYGLVRSRAWSAGTQLLFFQLVVAPCCVAIGYLFYRLVERPAMRWARSFFAAPRRLSSAVVTEESTS
jgi:peptidoglycan/LPS O-acetylase OafA/YrhL